MVNPPPCHAAILCSDQELCDFNDNSHHLIIKYFIRKPCSIAAELEIKECIKTCVKKDLFKSS